MRCRAAARLAVAAALALAVAPAAATAAASAGGVAAPASDAPPVTATPNATHSGFTGPSGGTQGSQPAAHPQSGSATTAATPPTDPNGLVAPGPLDVRPAGHRLTGAQAQAIADRVSKIVRIRAKNPGSYPGVFMKGPSRWQVSYYGKGKPLREIGQVTIDDPSATVLEAWTGFQVPWTMARGYKGAFGHKVNSVWIWIPLCLLFVAPFVNPRRPFRWLHLDLLVLVGFSASLAYFNHGEIGHSVPILYPLLAYLLGRMLWIGLRARAPDHEPLKLLVPTTWLTVGIVFLLGFRIGLNVTNSNVIDVGYGSAVGANLLAHGHQVYANFPTNIARGDTYGPVTYEAYIPFIKGFGFHDLWDSLPAAHAAAIAFDVMMVGLLWFLGRRMRGPTLGAALAYAWVCYPFTIFVTNTNSNDGLVALMLVVVLLLAARPALRGAAGALAGFTKFAPLALVPLLATQERRLRPIVAFGLGFVATTLAVWYPILRHGPSLHTIYDRTIGYQAARGAPFSIWGFPGALGSGPQHVWQVLAVLLALGVAVIPRRRDVVGLAALSAAVVIALEMGVTYWFYLYIVWFFPLVMVAVLGQAAEPAERRVPEPAPTSESATPEPELVPA